MIIHSYENSPRAKTCIEYLNGIDNAARWDKIILLPIPSMRDKQTILNTKVDINSIICDIDSNTFVSAYGLPSEIMERILERGAGAVDLECEEEFLLENAQLTALATLGIILTSERISVGDMHVGIVGYGRIGRRLVSMLMYLGADVRVFTSRVSTRLDLCECGVASVISSVDADLSGLNILINTAPAEIFSPDSVPEGLRIIDLASGDNFRGIDGVEKYPSIPAKMFPISAGRVWGRTLEKHLVNHL